ncbi:MAG: hypothetical protein JNM68_07105 [Dinghuibacter sp.]|nr:hypothetical protein [Dinghuibacter sp.]
MAKQSGIITLEGSINNMTFFKTSDGYLVRKQNKVSKERIATDPAFARTRENGAEFKTATAASKLLRQSLAVQIDEAKDRRTATRLTKLMLQVVKTDPVNDRGKRIVTKGMLNLLDGFEFNNGTDFSNTLKAVFEAVTDRATGKHSVTVAPFIPAKQVLFPVGATHFKLISAAVHIDFDAGVTEKGATESAFFPVDDHTPLTIPVLVNTTSAGNVQPLVMVLGIVFTQLVNGKEYPINDKSFNALRIVAVDVV